MILDQSESDGARDRPLHRHGCEDRTKQLAFAWAYAQLIERDEMRHGHNETDDDRRSQDAIRDGDVEERHHRHPYAVEDRNGDANAFGAEPVEPAEGEFPLLFARQLACAGQEAPPVLLQDLESAIGPAVPLLLVGLEAVRQQAASIAFVRIVRLPAELEQSETEIGVLADRIA